MIALVVAASNPFALLFILPSLHAWLWLPQIQDRPLPLRLALYAAGFTGPLLLFLSFASRYDLGVDTLWYLPALVSVGYVPLPLLLATLCWGAVAAQIGALALGRYAPYPAAGRPAGAWPDPRDDQAARALFPQPKSHERSRGGRRAGATPRLSAPKALDELEVPDGRAGRQLLGAGLDVDQRVCRARAHHHVRFLAVERAKQRFVALPWSRSRTYELVAMLVPANRRGQPPVRNRGSGSGRPRSAFTAGRTKSSNVTRTETGLPGRLKIGVSRRTLNATGFPGFTLTPQKTSSDSKLRLDGAHQVVRAHGCSSRGHEHVEAKQRALHRARSSSSSSATTPSWAGTAPASPSAAASISPFDS